MLFTNAVKPSLKGAGWREKLDAFDLVGNAFLVPALVCLMLPVQMGGTAPWEWGSARVIALFVASGVLAIIFGVHQVWRGDRALLPLRILRNRDLLAGAWFNLCIEGALLVVTYYVGGVFPFAKQSREVGLTASSSRSGSRPSEMRPLSSPV